MPEQYITFETATQQYNTVRQEIRQAKIRTLIALLASSILLFYLFSTLFGKIYYRGTLFFRVAAILNALSWLFWCLPSYSSVVRSIWARPDKEFMRPDIPQADLLEQYQFTLYEHRKQRFVTSVVEVLVALQFILMGMVVLFISF